MADDHEREGGFIENSVVPTLTSDTVVITEKSTQRIDSHTMCDDILEQAFVEVEDFNGNSSFSVSDVDTGIDAASESQVIVHAVVSEGSLRGEIVQSPSDGTLYENSGTETNGHAKKHVMSLRAGELDGAASSHDMDLESSHPNLVDSSRTIPEESVGGASLSVTLVPSNQASGAPLGSSQNPIRIIQQGNQYTPVQQLTADQLQQIMQVVQQQQLTRSAEEGGGHSILFNPQTNTRIVYRVIYPSELHKTADQPNRVTLTQGQQTGITLPKRMYRRRQKGEDDEDKVDGPELSREEKEARKKQRPRTRSGRVSKPPKHMVQDYKHIHVLDWDEDYDDSDGGYSDFKCSDEEGRDDPAKKERSDSPEMFQGLGSTRPKNFKCETCDKAYIGRAGLGRHYRLHPNHGSLPPETENDKAERTNGVGSTGSLSEDSNTQDSLPSTGIPSSAYARVSTFTRSRGKRSHRGRCSHLQDNTPLKRKARLREFIRNYEDEELMEVVLPRLANVITLWEFLLMKVERGGPAKPRADNIYREYEELYKHVERVCQDYLHPLSEGTDSDMTVNKMQIQNHPVAQALGLEAGTYEVRDMPLREESSFHYKYLTIEPVGTQGKRTHERRTVEIVTPDQLVSQQTSKKSRMMSLLTSTAVSIPDLRDNDKPGIINHSGISESVKHCVVTPEASHSSSVLASVPESQNIQQSQDLIQTVVAASSVSSQPVVLRDDLNTICCDVSSVSPSNMGSVQVIFRDALATAGSDAPIECIISDIHDQNSSGAVTSSTTSLLPQESVVTMSSSSTSYSFDLNDKCEESKQKPDNAADDISKQSVEQVTMNCQSSDSPVDRDELGETATVINSAIAESQVLGSGHLENQILTQTNIFQTDDGYFIIQNTDGTAYQIQSVDGNMPYEAVQAVMAMQSENELDTEGQLQGAMDTQ